MLIRINNVAFAGNGWYYLSLPPIITHKINFKKQKM